MPIVCLCSDCRWHARLSDLDVKIVNRHRDADNLPPAITPQRTGWPTLAVYLAWPPALQLLEIHRHWTERGLAVALEDADVAQHHDLGYERPGHAPPLPRGRRLRARDARAPLADPRRLGIIDGIDSVNGERRRSGSGRRGAGRGQRRVPAVAAAGGQGRQGRRQVRHNVNLGQGAQAAPLQRWGGEWNVKD
jgi:hypothetical protein